jgi:hypothetical protein
MAAPTEVIAPEVPGEPGEPLLTVTATPAVHFRRRGLALEWLRPLGVYAISRVLLLAAVGLFDYHHDNLPVRATLSPADGLWYLNVARNGYPHQVVTANGHIAQSTLGFFPGYPLLIRWTADVLPVGQRVAGLIWAALGGAAAMVLLWVLVRRLAGAEVADASVLLMCFFPGSFVFSTVYGEGLLLACAAVCLLALLDHRWVLAGLSAGLATAFRPNAIVLALCCAWAALGAIRRRGEWRALIAPLLAPSGMAAFFAFLWVRTGTPLAYYRTQRDAWGEHLDFGAAAWRRAFFVLHHGGRDLNVLISTLGLVFLAVAGVLLWRWRPPAIVTIYAVGIAALAVASSSVGARPRFVLTAFPFVVAVARPLKGIWLTATVAASALVLAGLTSVLILTTRITP